MIRTLRHVRLRSGERLRVAALVAPAGRYAKAIRAFLAHKGQPWLLHVDLANQGLTDRLRTTYYVGFLGRDLGGNVMIVDDGRVGILGHVFTSPIHRRKGICHELMAAALEGFRASGGRVLSLGTGFDSPAYWIYHGFGFRSVAPGSGHMLLELAPGAVDAQFAPGRLRVADARWHHWPGLSLLFLQPRGDWLRAYSCGVLGQEDFEGRFLDLQRHRAPRHTQAKVLLAGERVVGAAILQRDRLWPGDIYDLDLFVHPGFCAGESSLLRSLKLPRRAKIQAYLDRPSASRAATLRAAGFTLEATLRRQALVCSRPADVQVLSLIT
ncbi:MAG TPA: GNAT family N-acetyltransferase [Planctomycetota bacterium]|nr:GNAT family N-acetyltransferase [Planctomycetota bacterium]HRT96767.1 GNAT family N-acetyltransferase [Planctomycetota bacterium]